MHRPPDPETAATHEDEHNARDHHELEGASRDVVDWPYYGTDPDQPITVP